MSRGDFSHDFTLSGLNKNDLLLCKNFCSFMQIPTLLYFYILLARQCTKSLYTHIYELAQGQIWTKHSHTWCCSISFVPSCRNAQWMKRSQEPVSRLGNQIYLETRLSLRGLDPSLDKSIYTYSLDYYLQNTSKQKSPKLVKLFSYYAKNISAGTVYIGHTLARTDLLYMLNWGTQWTMVSYLKK